MVTIEINGQQVEAEQGQMLIEAADKAGITIPRFCYHKNLSIAASCRMCLVEVEKAPKPMPACATPVADGMIVNTKSTAALAAQKAVMEFLLINHPLDCPICDQGGECDLQEFSIGYGNDSSDYAEIKRVVKDKDIGPLIATELTRCIHCTRCVRFGQEIAGQRELGATGRGDWMEIGTYIGKSVDSELSGNIIDLCPVGALTSKVSRFGYRVWELANNDTIAAHDCVGSHCNTQTKNGQVKRVIARQNDSINDSWISDRDRYSFEALTHKERLSKPMIKKKDQWTEVSWDEALQFTADGLKAIADKTQIGTLCSPSATVEEMYLLEKLIRGIGSDNIDHRLRQTDFSGQDCDPDFLRLGIAIDQIAQQQAILLMGSNIHKEQPIIGHHIRQASLSGAKVSILNPIAYSMNYKTAEEFIVPPIQLFKELKVLAKAALEDSSITAPEGLAALVASVKVTASHQSCIKDLSAGKDSIILLGSLLQSMPNYASMRMMAEFIASATGSTLAYLTPGANSAGAYISGVLPHRSHLSHDGFKSAQGLDTQSMLAAQLKAYLLYNIEADLDIEQPKQAVDALLNAEFVVSLSPFVTDAMKQYSQVILPIAATNETSGSFVNVAGTWQSFTAVSKSYQQSKPGWKILRVMGNLFDLDDFDYQTSVDVLNEVKDNLELSGEQSAIANTNSYYQWQCPSNTSAQTSGLQRLAELSIYTVDSQTRRATALQKTQDAQVESVRINSALAKKLKLEDGQIVKIEQAEHSVSASLKVDDRITDTCVYLAAGTQIAKSLGGGFDSIELSAAE